MLTGNFPTAHCFWIYSSWHGFLCLHKLQASEGYIVSDVTPQESLPEPESARSPGQRNPFNLWITACPAPKVTVNVFCHITLVCTTFTQRSTASQRSAGTSEMSSVPTISCLQQQGKQNLMHFQSRVQHPEQTNWRAALI